MTEKLTIQITKSDGGGFNIIDKYIGEGWELSINGEKLVLYGICNGHVKLGDTDLGVLSVNKLWLALVENVPILAERTVPTAITVYVGSLSQEYIEVKSKLSEEELLKKIKKYVEAL